MTTKRSWSANCQSKKKLVEDYILRVETINNYISSMNIGAVTFTERELIRLVIMQRIPAG